MLVTMQQTPAFGYTRLKIKPEYVDKNFPDIPFDKLFQPIRSIRPRSAIALFGSFLDKDNKLPKVTDIRIDKNRNIFYVFANYEGDILNIFGSNKNSDRELAKCYKKAYGDGLDIFESVEYIKETDIIV